MNKIWNVDHYDHYQTVIDSDGNEVQAIIKCEMEKTMSYTTTQGTVKVVNPETNGQVKPPRNKIAEVEKMLKEVLYKKPLNDEQKESLWTVCLIHQLGFPATHEEIEKRLNNHPVDEVKSQYECENCNEGFIPKTIIRRSFIHTYQTCTCCNGNWQDCETCYRLSQLPKNVTASKTWLERNTHGSPKEREQARKNSEALNKGVDWSKVPEVIQPNEINWNRFIEGTDWDE